MGIVKSYEATTRIDASAEAVWSVLTNYSSYTDWDSGVVELTGAAALGSKIALTAAVSPKRPFKLQVTRLHAPSTMQWSGGMPLGLFRGVRTFRLTEEAGGTQVHVREVFTGPLVGLIWKTMPDLQPSFDQFVAGLRSRVEGEERTS